MWIGDWLLFPLVTMKIKQRRTWCVTFEQSIACYILSRFCHNVTEPLPNRRPVVPVQLRLTHGRHDDSPPHTWSGGSSRLVKSFWPQFVPLERWMIHSSNWLLSRSPGALLRLESSSRNSRSVPNRGEWRWYIVIVDKAGRTTSMIHSHTGNVTFYVF